MLIWIWMYVFVWTQTWMPVALGQEKGLPEYVVSECYGDIFNFDCGPGNKIRINRDFFGYSGEEGCRYRRGDCIISNPKSNSLIHRFCTGHRVCTYYMVERRGCGGFFSNYQQVEYQCIPDSSVTDVCSVSEYVATNTYIASPNFPENYPPNLHCTCVVSSATEGAKVQMEIVYLAIKYTHPCRDWLGIGRRRTCGTTVDLFQGRNIPIEFHSDGDDSHSGFWLHFHSSKKGGKVHVRCGNVTSTAKPKSKPSNRKSQKAREPPRSFRNGTLPEGKNINPSGEINDDVNRNGTSTRKRQRPGRKGSLKPPLDRGNRTLSKKPSSHRHLNRGTPASNQSSPENTSVSKDSIIQPSNRSESPGHNPFDMLLKDLIPSSTPPSANIFFDTYKKGNSRSSVPPGGSTNVQTGSDTTKSVDKNSDSESSPSKSKISVLLNGIVTAISEETEETTSQSNDKNSSENTDIATESSTGTEQGTTMVGEQSEDLNVSTEEESTSIEKDSASTEEESASTEEDHPSTEEDHSTNEEEVSSESTDYVDSTGISSVGEDEFEEDFVIFEEGPEDKDNTVINVLDITVKSDDEKKLNGTYNATLNPPTVPINSDNTTYEEESGIITLGLIVLCICIGVGILLIVLVLVIVYCKRKNTVNEQTQTNSITKHTTSTSISDLDGDSGQGLLAAAHAPNGNGLILDVDALYAKPHKADKSMQIDFEDDYDDIIIFDGDEGLVDSDSDSSSLYCTPYCDANHKAVQVTSQNRGGLKRNAPPVKPRPHMAVRRAKMDDLAHTNGIQINGLGEHDLSESDLSGEDVDQTLCHITDSDLDDFSNSEPEMDSARKKSIASMSELAEVTMIPQSALDSYDPVSDPDWDQRSGISI